MEKKYVFYYRDKDDGETVVHSFNTIERSVMVDQMCAFINAVGYGLPKYISDDINELIFNSMADEQDMKRKWDESQIDSDTE